MTMNVAGKTINELIISPDVYVQSPTSATSWYRVDYASFLKSAGVGDALGGSDPTQLLSSLRAVGSVTNEGSATIGGVATTHYHALVDLSRALARAPAAERGEAELGGQAAQAPDRERTIPIDVWIDGANLVRQIEMQLSVTAGSTSAAVSMTIDISDYGAQPAVSPPPADEVTDITGALGSQIPDALGGSPSSAGAAGSQGGTYSAAS